MMARFITVAFFSIAFIPGPSGAQDFGSPDLSTGLFAVVPAAFLSAEPVLSPLPPGSVSAGAFPRIPPWKAPQFVQGDDGGPGWLNRVFTGLGGALVGMGVGYFASQVVLSDWSEEPEKNRIQRTTWVAVGGSLGLAVGFSFPISGPGGGGSLGMGGSGVLRRTILAEEIGTISALDAFEVVRLLRPEWLLQRGEGALYDPRTDNIRVYLGEVEVGRVAALREVSTTAIESIRFIPAALADARWGPGHTQGVIQVITR